MAGAKTEQDVLEGIKTFFGALFAQMVVLALRDGGLVPVAEAGLHLRPDIDSDLHTRH